MVDCGKQDSGNRNHESDVIDAKNQAISSGCGNIHNRPPVLLTLFLANRQQLAVADMGHVQSAISTHVNFHITQLLNEGQRLIVHAPIHRCVTRICRSSWRFYFENKLWISRRHFIHG